MASVSGTESFLSILPECLRARAGRIGKNDFTIRSYFMVYKINGFCYNKDEKTNGGDSDVTRMTVHFRTT